MLLLISEFGGPVIELPQSADLIAQMGGLLEAEFPGGLLHFGAQLAKHHAALGGEEPDESVDVLAIVLLRDAITARRGALLDRITAIQLVLTQRFIDLGVDGGYFGDDYGAQKNLLFSPAQWRKLIKPRLACLFAPFNERGLPVIMHSDGQIQKILPDLVEIGLTTLNPVQPEVLDHKWLYENFRGKLSFYGGVSTQTVLPYGAPAEVQAAVRQCVRDLAPEKTGLLIGPSHRMLTDIPPSNVEALLAAVREL